MEKIKYRGQIYQRLDSIVWSGELKNSVKNIYELLEHNDEKSYNYAKRILKLLPSSIKKLEVDIEHALEELKSVK